MSLKILHLYLILLLALVNHSHADQQDWLIVSGSNILYHKSCLNYFEEFSKENPIKTIEAFFKKHSQKIDKCEKKYSELSPFLSHYKKVLNSMALVCSIDFKSSKNGGVFSNNRLPKIASGAISNEERKKINNHLSTMPKGTKLMVLKEITFSDSMGEDLLFNIPGKSHHFDIWSDVLIHENMHHAQADNYSRARHNRIQFKGTPDNICKYNTITDRVYFLSSLCSENHYADTFVNYDKRSAALMYNKNKNCSGSENLCVKIMTQKSKHKNNGLPLSPEKAQSFCEKVFAEGESQILKQFQLNVERLNRKQKGNQDPCSDLNSTQTVNPAEKA